MKRFAILLATMATLFGNAAHAATTGKGASDSANASTDFAWGIGLVGVAVIATVVGITAASSSSSPQSFSH